jgi:hypothetical protein
LNADGVSVVQRIGLAETVAALRVGLTAAIAAGSGPGDSSSPGGIPPALGRSLRGTNAIESMIEIC